MTIKIGYFKNNGDTAGLIINITEGGNVLISDPLTGETEKAKTLSDYKNGSAVILESEEENK